VTIDEHRLIVAATASGIAILKDITAGGEV